MGKNYLTKYECWDFMCKALLDTEHEAQTHCPALEIDAVYICELCGYQTYDNTEAEESCEHHK